MCKWGEVIVIELINITKKFGKFTAVNNLSLGVGEGQIFGFVGENGAGKTTVMKIIAGLLRANAGTVNICGYNILTKPREVKRNIGYMPDFFGVYDDLKVTEYMDFYCGIHKIPSHSRKPVVDKLLELVNLSDKKNFYVDNLSRGMKQRLCLSRSLIHDPKLLILDEPASGLDPRARVEMKEILKALKNMGKTVLISSHILPELSELCTSIGMISKGRMVISGTVDEMLKRISHNKKLRIRVLGEQDLVVRVLKENPDMGNISILNDFIEADFNQDEEKMAQVLKSLINANIPVVSFSAISGNLETLFMNITA